MSIVLSFSVYGNLGAAVENKSQGLVPGVGF